MKRQPWIKDFNWAELNSGEMPSPFIPPNEDNFSQKVVSEAFRDENEDKFKESLLLIDKPKIQSLFDGYYYDFSSIQPDSSPLKEKIMEMEKSSLDIQEEH